MLRVQETPILEVVFLSLTENASVVTNDTQNETSEIPTPPEIAVGTHFHV